MRHGRVFISIRELIHAILFDSELGKSGDSDEEHLLYSVRHHRMVRLGTTVHVRWSGVYSYTVLL